MSFSDQVKTVISTVAPMLGTALGGPLGGLAGGLIAKALGKEGSPATAAEVEKALAIQDPATMLALKKAEDDFTEHMRQLDVTEEQLQYQDVDSARKMAIAVKDSTPRNLAYVILLGTAVAIGATLMGFTHVDSALAGTLIGYMISECRSVLGFYFGSTQGSQAKDKTIKDMAEK